MSEFDEMDEIEIAHMRDQLARLRAELAQAEATIAELRGAVPELPPRPNEYNGPKLQHPALPRYGVRWNGPNTPIAVPMVDGYWTPFHLAHAALAAAPQPQPTQEAAQPVRVYLVPTGATHEGRETYERHDSPPPLCDYETLYAAPQPAADDQAARDAVDGWISCADRMPATDELVLVYVPALTSAPIIEIDNWAERCESPIPWASATVSTGYQWAKFEPEDVTHWRPLPALPIAADAAKGA